MNPINSRPPIDVGATTPLKRPAEKTPKVSQNENDPKAKARTTDGTEVEHNPNKLDPETAAESKSAQQAAHEKALAEMQAMKDAATAYTGVVHDGSGEVDYSGHVGYSGDVVVPEETNEE